jgi:hypothetical protein
VILQLSRPPSWGDARATLTRSRDGRPSPRWIKTSRGNSSGDTVRCCFVQ